MPSRKRRWWRWLTGLLGLVLVVAGVPTMLLVPTFVVTPEGFEPVARVRLLDLLQARRLRASAERLAQSGRNEAALRAWAAARTRHPGDPDLWRAALRLLAATTNPPPEVVAWNLGSLSRFLRLGGTNEADLELIAAACAAHDANEELCQALDPLPARPSGPVGLAHARALLRTGRATSFHDRITASSGPGSLPEELRWYAEAWQAGWGGSGKEADDAWKRVRSRAEETEADWEIQKLELLVAGHRGEAAVARAALERLERCGRETTFDHALLWEALRRAGEVGEARQLARSHRPRLREASEILAVARACWNLGLAEHCAACLDACVDRIGYRGSESSVALLVFHSDLLMRQREWLKLQELLESVKAQPGNRDRLRGCLPLLEGCLEWTMVYTERSAAHLREAAVLGFPTVETAIQGGIVLTQFGQADEALTALRPHLARLGEFPGAWEAVWNACLALRRDSELLLTAARAMHDAAPDDESTRLNLAAALMIAHREPAQALALTWDLHTARPGSLVITLNHALSLSLNHRFEEARTLLAPLNPGRLTETERPTYLMAQLEIQRGSGRRAEVHETLQAIDRSSLFPSQQRWLEEVEAEAEAGAPDRASE